MTKVVYIANYREQSGYSQAARDYILSLDSVGVNVVPRAVKMINKPIDIPDRIRQLEQQDLKNVDAVIQHNLPDNFSYRGGVRNIGMYAYETDSIVHTNWSEHLKMMDGVVVFASQLEFQMPHEARLKSHVINHATDVSRFERQYEETNFGCNKDCFIFYTIGEWNKRKNMYALLSAYYSEFMSSDNVALIIKTNIADGATFKNATDAIKETCRRFQSSSLFPPVVLINQDVDDQQICRIHQNADVFVTASHGEAWCLPATDALGFGNPVIAPDHTAFLSHLQMFDKYNVPVEYIDTDVILYTSESQQVMNTSASPFGLYTCDEQWYNPSIVDLRNRMREVYSNRSKYLRPGASDRRREIIKSHMNYETVGKQLTCVIKDAK